ncbi:hypothetical protein [Kibdelosporangium phytohabitans]|uniref:Uncharacterized protein n=1 Tax=Kibdelosporangium phytohabitans TaxID=860235 RepID=A0A0N9HX11_9PSEU|nr:hypothetical protein [Kibdelosporangium phytohabitans]ALG06436.1 hypothetical protein AOZ06_05405 [Kibdelosporangium phytohabitans]MBE1467600.1 hypothetical protein [Kibdelosporangium phytohabitans]
MAVDAIESKLDEIQQWAADRPVDRDELRLALELARDHLGHATPGAFVAGDIDELLLEIYPSRVLIPSEADAVHVVEAVRDLVSFLGETTESPSELLTELEDAVPEFFESVRENMPAGNGLIDLLEELGLPTDELPGVRLPGEEELLLAARQSELLAKAYELAEWAADGKPIDVHSELLTEEAATAAQQALGIADRLHLIVLQDLAEFTGFASTESGSLARGARFGQWPDGDEVAEIWQTGFVSILGFVLDRAADVHGYEIDFSDVAPNLLIMMFLARDIGVPYEEISDVIHELTEPEWHGYAEAHGDPAQLLVEVLTRLGAVEVVGEHVRYTPLALSSVREQMIANGVEIPLLPPAEEMTAQDLASLAVVLQSAEMQSEVSAWLAVREAVPAARELLAVAANGSARVRVWATNAVNELGDDVKPVWRELLGDDVLGPYAKYALAEEDLEVTELGWITIDSLSLFVEAAEQGVLDETHVLAQLLPAGHEEELLEAMWRLPHPEVAEVLHLVGTHHPDKKVAKYARKAAHKATTFHTNS